jgi:hypothetical protein
VPAKRRPSVPTPVEASFMATSGPTSPPPTSCRPLSRKPGGGRPSATPTLTRSLCGWARPMRPRCCGSRRRRSISRRRSTRGCWSRTCAGRRWLVNSNPSSRCSKVSTACPSTLSSSTSTTPIGRTRMVLGDSLAVLASLAGREQLRGKVQMVYLGRGIRLLADVDTIQPDPWAPPEIPCHCRAIKAGKWRLVRDSGGQPRPTGTCPFSRKRRSASCRAPFPKLRTRVRFSSPALPEVAGQRPMSPSSGGRKYRSSGICPASAAVDTARRAASRPAAMARPASSLAWR